MEAMLRKKKLFTCVGFLFIFSLTPAYAAVSSSGPAVTARSAILIDRETGEVLWERSPDLPLPPASTTKIVTALLALQSGRLDDSLSVTPEAAQAPPSKISLRPGWKMRVRDLTYAVLLNSANDASVVIAQGLAGSVSGFAERMNAEARQLGARNTHFVNPNGLPAANHYSTARDLATIFGHALENPLFNTIVHTKTAAVWPSEGSTRRIALRSHNRLLGNYRIEVVGKTGWTIAARKCFVGAARADGREVTFAVLGSNDLWGDLRRLLAFGFGGAAHPAPAVPEVQTAALTTDDAAGDNDSALNTPQRARKYSVQLATFPHLRGATNLKKKVSRHGYPARVEQVRQGGRHLYRVSIGTYSDRREAQRVASRLRKGRRHLPAVVVVSS
jgi:D-alanyl-D-alanine carboxypeptidase